MKTDKIRVLVVDDSNDARENVCKLLAFEEGVEVVGTAQDGDEALEKVRSLQPDCVLMDINMPKTDGIQATELIRTEAPNSVIIMMSVQGEQEYLRKAMVAGARDFLVKPFSGDELVNTIRSVWELETKRRLQAGVVILPQRSARVVVVFSAKGGVGKSTIATNLAVAMSHKKEVILIDLDLQFGDVAVMLNLDNNKTIADWIQEDNEPVENCLIKYSPTLQVLAAPEQPEEGELVTTSHVEQVIHQLRSRADFLVIDTPQTLNETVLQALELADEILLVATPDLPNLKNMRRCLELLVKLQLENKVKVVVNRASQGIGLSAEDFHKHLGKDVWQQVPSDGRLVVESANQGVPFVAANQKARISLAIKELSLRLNGDSVVGTPKRKILGLW